MQYQVTREFIDTIPRHPGEIIDVDSETADRLDRCGCGHRLAESKPIETATREPVEKAVLSNKPIKRKVKHGN